MDDEIDLRRYVRVVWRRRYMVGVCALLAALAVGFVSTLSPPAYETSALVLMTPSPLHVGGAADAPGPKIETVLLREIPTETLVAFARSRATMGKLAQEMADGAPSNGAFPEVLTVQTIRNTNLVELRVRGRDPQRVTATANKWAALVASSSLALFAAEAQQSFAFFDSRLEEMASRLQAAEQAQREFEAGSRLQVLEARDKALTDLVAGYEVWFTDLGVVIARVDAERAQVDRQLQVQPKTLVLRKSITSDPLLHAAATATDKSTFAEISKLRLQNEELNPVYITLAQAGSQLAVDAVARRTERERVALAMVRLNHELGLLRAEIGELKLLAGQFARAVSNETQLYNVLLQRREEARIASVSQAGFSRVVAEATVPSSPAPARTLFKAAIAGILGLVTGAAAALVLEYFSVAPSALVPAPAPRGAMPPGDA